MGRKGGEQGGRDGGREREMEGGKGGEGEKVIFAIVEGKEGVEGGSTHAYI